MKKHITLFLALAMILSLLVACGDTAKTSTETPVGTSAETQVETPKGTPNTSDVATISAESDPTNANSYTAEEAKELATQDFQSGEWDGSPRLYGDHLLSIDLEGHLWCDGKKNYRRFYYDWPSSLSIISEISTPADLYAMSIGLSTIDHYENGLLIESFNVVPESGERMILWNSPKDGSSWIYARGPKSSNLYGLNYQTGEFVEIAEDITQWGLWTDEMSNFDWGEEGSPQSKTGYANFIYEKAGQVYSVAPPDFEPEVENRVEFTNSRDHTEAPTDISINQVHRRNFTEEEATQMATIRSLYRDGGWDGSFKLVPAGESVTGEVWGIYVDTRGFVYVNNTELGHICLPDFTVNSFYARNICRSYGYTDDPLIVAIAEDGMLTVYTTDDEPLKCELLEDGVVYRILNFDFFYKGYSRDEKERAFSVVVETTRKDGSMRLDLVRGNLDNPGYFQYDPGHPESATGSPDKTYTGWRHLKDDEYRSPYKIEVLALNERGSVASDNSVSFVAGDRLYYLSNWNRDSYDDSASLYYESLSKE